jgi:hypothetical protein
MYRIAGVREGSDMTVDDFKKIFASKEYAHTLEKATLNLDGKYLFRLHTIYYHYFVSNDLHKGNLSYCPFT